MIFTVNYDIFLFVYFSKSQLKYIPKNFTLDCELRLLKSGHFLVNVRKPQRFCSFDISSSFDTSRDLRDISRYFKILSC